jgi:hypothetical protein
MKPPFRRFALAAVALLLVPAAGLRAWDYEGHRIVNQLALQSLPADFPAFVHEPAAAERIAFLAGEPDRWRNLPDLPLKQYNAVDHYFDLEQVTDAGLDVARLPSMRYDFAVQYAEGRKAHPENFPAIEPEKNTDHTREWTGFAPWAIAEYYGKLRSQFSYLKVFQDLGTPEEVANAQANIVYVMGVMGHYVGDCAQPLHATKHHHGWVGDNPLGYTTWSGIHGWIDGGFLAKAHIKYGGIAPRVTPATAIALTPQADGRDPLFVATMDYLIATLKRVEPLYQLEKEGKFSDEVEKAGKGEKAGIEPQPVSTEGRAFIEAQLLRGGEMLGAIWLTAWRNSPPDTYLRAQLLKRQAAAGHPAGVQAVAAQPEPAKPVAADIKAAEEYWGSAKGTTYHRPSCQWAQKTKPANRVVFKSKEEAVKAGYHPCGDCKP